MTNAVTLAQAGSNPMGMKNMLINGDFRIWQKGSDLNPATTGNAVTTADRWTSQYTDFTSRVRKVEDTINGEVVDTYEVTKLSGTYGSAEISQKVEYNTAKYLRGQTVTFSFWVKKVGSSFGSHITQFWLGDSETVDDTGWTNSRTYDRGRSSGVTGTATTVTFTNNNWTQYSVTRTLNSDTNTIYCTIYSSSTPVNEGIRIAKCQLEVGSVATSFERRPMAMEFSMCQRYYEQCSWVPLTTNNYQSVSYKVTKRTTPTVTLIASDTGTASVAIATGYDGQSFYQNGNSNITTRVLMSANAEF